MSKKPTLLITPHPNAPLFANGGESAALLFKQLQIELTSQNFTLNEELWHLIRQACLVNLWFFLKFIIGYAAPFDRLNDTLHVEMCNFRQTLIKPGSRGIMILPRGHGKTKVCTEGGAGWESIRNPNQTTCISNAITETAMDFYKTVRGFFDANELLERIFPEHYVSKPKSQERWNEQEFVLPSRTINQREPTLEYGGVTASREGHHYVTHIVDDPIGLAALNSNRGGNAVMTQAKNWFWDSEKTLGVGVKSRVIVVLTRYAVDDVGGSILEETNECFGYPIMDWEPSKTGHWKAYYRKAVEFDEVIWPQEFDLQYFEEMKEKRWWTWITQYQNEPQSSGMAEFSQFHLKDCTLEYEQRERESLWFIAPKDKPEAEEIYLGNCDLIVVGDPAATERNANARTSRSVVLALATNSDGRIFIPWLRAGYVSPSGMFDWFFEVNKKFRGYVRATYLETNGPFKVLVDWGPLRKREREEGISLRLQPFASAGNKDGRIRTQLEPEFIKGMIYSVPDAKTMIREEMIGFPLATKKDILDAMASAVMKSNRPFDEIEIYKREMEDDDFDNRECGAGGY